MKPFTKRKYRSLREFCGDIRFLLANARRIRAATHGAHVSPTFRERLNLAATQVSQCRFCTFVHSKAALKEGVSREEIGRILSAEFGDCPEEEVPGLLYAQHWAENRGRPDDKARAKLAETYGEDTATDIDLILRAIRAGNYTGNTVEYFLNRITFGLVGG